MSARQIMRTVEQVKHNRQKRAARQRTVANRASQMSAFVLGIISVLAALASLAARPAFDLITYDLPPVEQLEALFDPNEGELLQPTEFYDRTGQHLLLSLQPAGLPRVFLQSVPNPDLANAFVASQDPDFWKRASLSLLRLEQQPQGIAERLMADLLLANEPEGWLRTTRARILAADAIERYGKPQILAWALNSAYFGHWALGIESAAQLYFGKSAAQLSLAESALLAAVAQAPALNPFDAPELAVEYQHLVLAAMRDQGMITDQDFVDAFAAPLTFTEPRELAINEGPQHALAQLEDALGSRRVQLGGLNVITTFDFALSGSLDPTAQIAVLDPINGQVLAIQNGASLSGNPVGNSLVPFEYLPIFAQGYSPASLYWDVPTTPRFALADFAGPTTLRSMLAGGKVADLGLQADAFGASQELLDEIGADHETVTALQLAVAYGTLASNGWLAGRENDAGFEPTAILFVGDSQDSVVLDWINPSRQNVTSPELAALVTDVLADLSSKTEPLPITPPSREAAWLTADNWTIVYSPQRVVVMHGQGADWVDALNATHANLPSRNWETPAGLTSLIVCVPSGLLPDEDCPQTRRELFLVGTEPNQADTLYETVAINNLNGALATVFTPAAFVEDQLFMAFPQVAARWALASGIEEPPVDYDTVAAFTATEGPTLIASPTLFSQVSGLVEISAVLGDDTANWDIQVGQGLRPTSWHSLAAGTGSDSGVLAEWETARLSGVWAIQLQAWDQDGKLTRAFTIVTIGD